jgi:hypothetical protein
MNRIRETRGGRAYDARFGARMRGQGEYARLLGKRFERTRTRLGLDTAPTPLETGLFQPPPSASGQMTLF